MQSARNPLRALVRDPLVHFTMIGIVLFAAYAARSGGSTDGPDRIVVTEEQVALLAAQFERTWSRPPAAAELEALVEEHVKEEILFREALALQLERDDPVVRRRLRQKIEFVADGLVDTSAPTDEELRAYLDANPDRFRVPERSSFRQIFFAPPRSDARTHVAAGAGADPAVPDPLERRAATALELLRRDPERGAELGDPTLLPYAVASASDARIGAEFGHDFATALAATPLGEWKTARSSFGLHLVRVDAREPPRLPPLDEIRSRVARDWAAEQRARAGDSFYRTLRARYEVQTALAPQESQP